MWCLFIACDLVAGQQTSITVLWLKPRMSFGFFCILAVSMIKTTLTMFTSITHDLFQQINTVKHGRQRIDFIRQEAPLALPLTLHAWGSSSTLVGRKNTKAMLTFKSWFEKLFFFHCSWTKWLIFNNFLWRQGILCSQTHFQKDSASYFFKFPYSKIARWKQLKVKCITYIYLAIFSFVSLLPSFPAVNKTLTVKEQSQTEFLSSHSCQAEEKKKKFTCQWLHTVW